MKNIIVVGGAGFIGSHLCEKLVEHNKVVCIDNLISGNIENIEDLFNKKNFQFLNKDARHFSNKSKLNKIFKDNVISEIYYLASIASPKLYLMHPLETIGANIYGLKNFLDIANIHRSKFFYSSTSEVYGHSLKIPFKEENCGLVETTSERGVYDETKRVGETIVMTYNRKFRLKTKIVRIFNTYGPKMGAKDGRVIPTFINQCLNNKDITIYGDGSQTRSFCYVDDMVTAIIKSMASKYPLPINVGNPLHYYTIEQVARKIKSLMHSRSMITYHDFICNNDPPRRRPHIKKANSILNWEPEISFEDGLKKTITYFEGQRCLGKHY